MSTLVGERALARKHGGAAAREKSLCAIRPVQVRIGFRACGALGKESGFGLGLNASIRTPLNCRKQVTEAALQKPIPRNKGFVEEVRFQLMRLQAEDQPVEEYLKFLVNSEKVYGTMVTIALNSSHPSCESISYFCMYHNFIGRLLLRMLDASTHMKML